MKKIREARYKILGDGSYFGEIPTLPGVWASAVTLEDWILLKKEWRGY